MHTHFYYFMLVQNYIAAIYIFDLIHTDRAAMRINVINTLLMNYAMMFLTDLMF